MRLQRLRTVGLVLLLALLASSCRTGNDIVIADPTPIPTAVPAATPTTPPAPEPTLAPEPTVDRDPTATAVPAVPTAVPDLPGEPWDLFVPASGELVAVVGVAFDDILEVHQVPGENSPLVGVLAPLDVSVLALGEGRQLPNSIWWKVSVDGLAGWAGSRFMSRLGVTNDVTSQVIDSLGVIPSAETMLDLGMLVANARASEDPPSRIVVTVAPTIGDLGEITIDVVGLGDDAVEGERLHIFGQPTESGEGFSLKSVEATVMCSRGVTESGLCL